MKTIYDYFNKLGYTQISPEFYKLMDIWESYYKGDVSGFHTYNQYNGIKMVKKRRKTLNMAKKICEDKADLLFNERFKLNLADEESLKFIEEVFYENDFYTNSNKTIERANALGTAAFVSMFDGEKITIDYVNGKNIYPLTFDQDKVIECGFASEKYINGEKHVYINLHLLENHEYVIKNLMLKYEKNGLKEVAIPKELFVEKTIETKSRRPFFQIIRPCSVNSTGYLTPMGMPAFATSIDILHGIDTIYDSFINEFELGKKRIFIDSSLAQVSMGEDGARLSPVFDTNDVCFYGLSGLRENGEFIKEVNMNIRSKEHIEAININLGLLSAKCGLGRYFYTFDKAGLKTATEVMSENSDLYRRVKKDEIPLEKNLMDLIKTIIYMGNKYLGEEYTDSGLSIKFDDSIIEDTNTLKMRELKEKEAGLIDNET